jgi:isopentenyldiphosphate isomerase
VGSFNDILDLPEQRILAEAMNIPYDNEQTQKQSLLNQIVYTGSSKIYSQANHIDSVLNVAKNQYFNIVTGMINEYSYKSQKSLSGLKGGS